MSDGGIELIEVAEFERAEFVAELQRAFLAGIAESGASADEPIPSQDDVNHSLAAEGAVALHVAVEGERMGGVIVRIDEHSQDNTLDFFFIRPEKHGLRIGQAAWRAVEQRYPSTRTWETMTPYFEQRNIHFYVNRCGFSIVEFFHPGHPDPHHVEPGSSPDTEHSAGEHADDNGHGPDLMFRFRKVMPTRNRR